MDKILELAKEAGLRKEHGSDREYIGDFDWRLFAQLISQNTCKRCGKVHNGPAFDEQVAINKAGDEIAREIDRMVMTHAGIIHEGDGGYELSTHEKYEEFNRKRNYTWTTSQEGKSSDNSSEN
jgi:hypothetical protein